MPIDDPISQLQVLDASDERQRTLLPGRSKDFLRIIKLLAKLFVPGAVVAAEALEECVAAETKNDQTAIRLFKYLHPDRTAVLRDATIRFTSPKVLNDPFELKPHISAFSGPEYVSSPVDDLLRERYTKLPEQVRMIVSLKIYLNLAEAKMPAVKLEGKRRLDILVPGIRNALNQTLEDMLGTLCLAESPTSLLMWAHYADSHQGFVVEFDPKFPFFNQRLSPNDDLRHLRKVIYKDTRPDVTLSET
jgi:hypothetical protein